MIAFVHGRIFAVQEDALVVEVGGVGLQVLAPVNRLRPQPLVGEDILLHTQLLPREDSWLLFGFAEERQLALFRQLMAVSGIGPKLALSVIDQLGYEATVKALAAMDYQAFAKVKGLGKTKAQRLIVDLKNKFKLESGELIPDFLLGGNSDLSASSAYSDVLAALEQMGYSSAEARAFTLQAQNILGKDADSNQLLKEAVRQAALA